jgi:anti-sigma factor ChrR (cupin superfamily)
MPAKQPVNADPNVVVVVNTNDMPWEATEHRGVSVKVVERVIDARKGRETAFVKIEPGASIPEERLAERLDIFILEGSLSDGGKPHGEHTFIRKQPGDSFEPASDGGCTYYVKRRVPIRPTDSDRLEIDSKKVPWTPFPHRGADVLHLYRDPHGIETSRFGQIKPDRKIPMHDHAMGEETYILGGALIDEYTAYTPGYWFRMPIGVPHTPYTKEGGCLMLVREGDLVW